jgi:hypothetical protein
MTVYEYGVDYADQRPDPAALVAAGKTFACRYGGPGRSSKQIDAAELRALTSHGISVVANAEGAADGFVGAAAGASWARDARDHFAALGKPSNRPIYFSVDFNVTSADYPRIDAALRAAAGVIGAENVGVYGEYNLMRHCKAAGTARWFWQTLAWSGGSWSTDINHIEQYRNAVGLGGAVLDLNRAVKPDYGQWGVEDMSLDDSDKQWMLANLGPQPIASKIGVDLNNTNSGVALGTVARTRDALNQFWADAYHASMQDTAYAAADAGTQQRMRFARDIVRGTVGGPVNQTELVAAINAADQISDADKQAIAAAVLSGMDYRGIADAVVAALPQDQVQSLLDALAARLQS